jgi:16S rRNA (cytosine967-C5)-methyltransferase
VSDPVRGTAFDVLRAVDERDAYVNLVLPALLDERGLTGRDAALATELTHGTLRRRGTYDAILGSLSRQGIGGIDPPVLDALRLGTHQLLGMRVPAHAAVSTTVDLVRRTSGHKPVGFANALLRRVGERDLDTWITQLTAGLEPDEATSIRTSHPVWIVQALRDALGEGGDLEALLDADNLPPKVTLVARPGLSVPDELPGTPGRWSPFARMLDGGDPGGIAAVRDGRAGGQDEG